MKLFNFLSPLVLSTGLLFGNVMSSSFPTALSKDPPLPMLVEFQHNGLILSIENNDVDNFILHLEMVYCDGTKASSTEEDQYLYMTYVGEGIEYLVGKPLKLVRIFSIDRASAAHPYSVMEKRRSCDPEPPKVKLYCNQISFPPTIHGTLQGEPIAFSGSRRIYQAGLKLPGVDGIFYARDISRSGGYFWTRTIGYDFPDRQWFGFVPTMKMPVGQYQNVELVVEDGFGTQAKCPMGSLTVLP